MVKVSVKIRDGAVSRQASITAESVRFALEVFAEHIGPAVRSALMPSWEDKIDRLSSRLPEALH